MKHEKMEFDSGPPYTPQLNGVSERFNKTIEGKIRAQMCDSGLPASMWELAAETAVHSYNITPHKSIKYEVPLTKFSPKARCNLERIRRFGCISYVKLPKIESKFSSVAIKTVLVGYTSTGYILWHPGSRKFLESKHVRFIERLSYKDVYKKKQDKTYEIEHQSCNSFEIYDEKHEHNDNTQEKEKHDSENLAVNEPYPRKRGRPKKADSEKQNSEKNQEKPGNDQIIINN